MKKLELLSPARDLETGKAAIDAGADAVYIGAPKFGARSAVSNSIPDIEQLIKYAHFYNAKVYATLNTILTDAELDEAVAIIHQLYQVGIDAVIIQDLGLLECNLPPVAIFASTQTDNRTPEKVKFLEQVGFKRAVLARELSLDEISAIRQETEIELEAFIHGALCVCYSGQCYLSYSLSKRSSNRGECAQPCRLPYNLVDATGQVVLRNKHLLSLQDLDLSEHIQGLIDAGVTSFKIEGRLKDAAYVRNVTAHYRNLLDGLILKNADYKRTSSGKSIYNFTPDTSKTFHRRATDYFIQGRKGKIASFDTPKSTGQKVGTITKVMDKKRIQLVAIAQINNNDGLCFFDSTRKLQGVKVNNSRGNMLELQSTELMETGTILFRNFDHEFTKILNQENSCIRKIEVRLRFSETETGYCLELIDEDGNMVMHTLEVEKELAKNNQKAIENIRNQLIKSGNTPFEIIKVKINLSQSYFLPASVLNEMRRLVLQQLTDKRNECYQQNEVIQPENTINNPETNIDYRANVLNQNAVNFYKKHGVDQIAPAFESDVPVASPILMTTKHCILWELDKCLKINKKVAKEWKFPLTLEHSGTKLSLEFDCKACVMNIR